VSQRSNSGLKRAVERLAAPLLAFTIARAMLSLIAEHLGFPAFKGEIWGHWDTGHYLAIAAHGYEFFSCAKIPGYDPMQWCGNTAWLPGYALLPTFALESWAVVRECRCAPVGGAEHGRVDRDLEPVSEYAT
jgi:hypothetical protein